MACAGAALAVAGAAGCSPEAGSNGGHGAGGGEAVELTPAPAGLVEPLARGPISYFQQRCAACHGAHGSQYLPGFASREGARDLRTVVEEMAAGPAMSPVDGEDLEALTAFHRALSAGAPFVAWLGRDGGDLVGEVMPGAGAEVEVRVGDRSFMAEVNGHAWRAAVGDAKGEVMVRAVREGREAVVLLSERAWSEVGETADGGGRATE